MNTDKFSIFDNLPYRVYVRDKSGVIVYANELTKDILHLSHSQIICCKYEDVFKDDAFIEHLKRHDKIFFSNKMKSLVSIQEQNKYYHKESIFKVIDFLDENQNENFIVTILVDLNDTFNTQNGLSIPSLGGGTEPS